VILMLAYLIDIVVLGLAAAISILNVFSCME